MQWGHQTFYTNYLSLVGRNLNEIKCDPNTYINHAAYLNWTSVEKQIDGVDCSGVTCGMAIRMCDVQLICM